MAKRSVELGGRQNPRLPELSEVAKEYLRQIAEETGWDYHVLLQNASQLCMKAEELRRLARLVRMVRPLSL